MFHSNTHLCTCMHTHSHSSTHERTNTNVHSHSHTQYTPDRRVHIHTITSTYRHTQTNKNMCFSRDNVSSYLCVFAWVHACMRVCVRVRDGKKGRGHDTEDHEQPLSALAVIIVSMTMRHVHCLSRVCPI